MDIAPGLRISAVPPFRETREKESAEVAGSVVKREGNEVPTPLGRKGTKTPGGKNSHTLKSIDSQAKSILGGAGLKSSRGTKRGGKPTKN